MPRPNILLLLTDQHRLSALGCYGATPCRTPNIDRLAAEGVRFETAYTCCPVCTPARASIMTGLHVHAHGMMSNTYNYGSNVSELSDSPALLSRRLAAAGYRCGYTGKWHLGTRGPHGPGGDLPAEGFQTAPFALPTTRGFEGQDFPGHGGGGFCYEEYQRYLDEHGWTHSVRPAENAAFGGCGVLAGPVEATVPYFLAEHTIGLIDRFSGSGRPWFIWHNNWGPHSPYLVTEEFLEPYRNVDIPPWPNYRWDARRVNLPCQVRLHPDAESLTWEQWAESIRYYYAFATMLDGQFGRILEHLERTHQAENTVVIFASDHGETCGSHGGLMDKGFSHFEEVQRIGLILKDPRGRPDAASAPPGVRTEWASLLDLYPTICDLAGAEVDGARVHGRSLAPLVAGQVDDWRDEVFVEFFGVVCVTASMITCRHNDLKYGWNCSSWDELYDLAADPHETRNLIHEPAYADAADRMRRRIERFMERTKYHGLSTYRASRRL